MKRGSKVRVKSSYRDIPAGSIGTLMDDPGNAIFKSSLCPLVRVAFTKDAPKFGEQPYCIWYRLDEIEPETQLVSA